MDKNSRRIILPHFTLVINVKVRTILFEPHDTAQCGHKFVCLSYVGGFAFVGFEINSESAAVLSIPPDDSCALAIDVRFEGKNPNLRDYLGYSLRIHRDFFELRVVGKKRYKQRFDEINEWVDLCTDIPMRLLVTLGKPILTEHKIKSESNVVDISGGEWLGNQRSGLVSAGTQELTVHFMPNREMFKRGRYMVLENVISGGESQWRYVAS